MPGPIALRSLRPARQAPTTLHVSPHPAWRTLSPAGCKCSEDEARYIHGLLSSPAVPLVLTQLPGDKIRHGLWVQIEGARGLAQVKEVAAMAFDHYIFRLERTVGEEISNCYVAVPSRSAKPSAVERYRFSNRTRQFKIDRALYALRHMNGPSPGHFTKLAQSEQQYDEQNISTDITGQA
ncbi:hypothetical protein PsYK624_138290 [Phanerochaete sordida]|uniref:Uncharacterized protein n=1 Tax=Phanerochaete sordida TaxID=48140 RepID=A0A9P3GKL1_9APHY|nr:hypothetical protein PsYK624_138290 [Phanerochaete sordida]